MSYETKFFISGIVLVFYVCFLLTSLFDQNQNKKYSGPMNGIFIFYIFHVIFCIFTDYIDCRGTSVFWQYVCCIGYSVTGHLALYCYGRYFRNTCEAKPKTLKGIKKFNNIILALNLLTTLPFIPSGLYFSVSPECVYTRGPLFIFSYLFVFIELITLAFIAVLSLPNKNKAVGYVCFCILPVAASISMLIFPRLSGNLNDVAAAISCSILYSFVYLSERRKALENEANLTQYKADVMMSQIRPHFIYNTLSTIAALCQKDPKKAEDLTVDFSEYLRTNLNMSNSRQLIPFSAELAHTKKYLDIEKVRFGDRIKTDFVINETDFMLPSLSLQPIVENAVKHGITQKREGGIIRITTEKKGDYYAVIVEDNGVGFDSDNMVVKEGHYGLLTARERIKILVGGMVTIDSTEGVGTVVTILVKGQGETRA